MAEFEQLAADPHVAPERVLLRQPEHQLLALSRQLRPPGTAAAAECRPAPTDQSPVPAQDGGRLHQEQRAGGQLTAERGQDHSIGCPPARPPGGASEDKQLLAEDEEFEIAIGTRSTTDDEEIDQQAEEGVQEGQQHRAASVGLLVLSVKPPVVACPRVSGRLSDVGSGEAEARRSDSRFRSAADPPEPADE
jgi:hypothetical protein